MAKAVRSAAFRYLILAAGLSCYVSVAFGEEFYEQQLRIGKADLASGRTVQASDELRIAAFGLLERPPMLCDALVSLALAQNTLGQKAAVAQTINRFLDVERRFSVYESASIDPQSRVQFESLLLKNALRSDLVAIPGLARLFRGDADKVSDLPVERRAAAYEEGSRRSPKDVAWPLAAARDAAAQGLDPDAIRWSRRALSIDNRNSNARAILVHALARRGECREALTQIASLPPTEISARTELKGDQFVCLVGESRWNDADAAFARLTQTERSRTDVARASDTLSTHRNPSAPRTIIPSTPGVTVPATTMPQRSAATVPSAVPSIAARTADTLASARALVGNGKYLDAVRLLGPAVAAEPGNRSLHLAMLEAASLARDWRTALAQVVPSSPFISGEEASMFYASAALYENGRQDEARQLMLRARPKLQSTPFVDYYSNIILGRSTNR